MMNKRSSHPITLSWLVLYMIAGIFFSSVTCADIVDVIKVTPKQLEFKVTLPANITTGFQWTVVSYDKTKLNLVKSEYVAPMTNIIGARGASVFTFSPEKKIAYPNSTVIMFKYARSWEPTSAITRNIIVQFDQP